MLVERNAQLIESLKADFLTLAGAEYLGAKVHQSRGETFTSGVAASINFDQVLFDRHRGIPHWTDIQPTRLTCQQDGLYMAVGSLYWDSNATGHRTVNIRVNGTTIVASATTSGVNLNSANRLSASATLELEVGDYIELRGIQNSGGNLDTGVLGEIPSMTLVRLLGW
jgi:hypothetical protein